MLPIWNSRLRSQFDAKAEEPVHGFAPEEIDRLIADGFTTEDIEEMLYCG